MSKPQVADVIEKWLVNWLSNRVGTGRQEIDVNQPFAYYGLTSIEGLNLVRELEGWLGCSLSPILAWNHPTIAALAGHLASDPAVIEKSPVFRTTTEKRAAEPIAIIGMACRFPGAADLASFWQLLSEGRDVISEVPADRWDIEALYDPDPAQPGKMIGRWGGFLAGLDKFDAHFFGISPREAPHVDPRQRLLLEVAWEALEDAGLPPHRLAGSQTGVFVAALNNDYDHLLFNDFNRVEAYSGPGVANSILANRLSYFLDWHGPSLTLDTACSGSLVALHLACQSLQNGESTLALVGGVNVNLMPKGNLFFSKAGALSPDGRCKTFSDEAAGIVRSEGAAVVILKPLSQARADGDPIYGVIYGTAVNQDGRSNGIMAPNGLAQEAVLHEAYRRAGISPGQVQYIEAHGTGTRLGDPIEVQALGNVLKEGRVPGRRCAIGSVKSNLGHLEPAAGLAGLIKVALAFRHQLLPPTLHFQQANPLIPFAELPLTVQDRLSPWPFPEEQRVAGVSSFGFGGTNAHVVLAEAPEPLPQTASDAKGAVPYLLPLSARSLQALPALARAYADSLNSSQAAYADICYTASTRRSHHDHRLALVAHSPAEAAEQLAVFAQNEPGGHPVRGNYRSTGLSAKLVFVFSGQGSHWRGMGRELLAQEAVFRSTIEECDRLLRHHVPWSLLDYLQTEATDASLNQTDKVQPAIFAVQVALAALWRSWGIEPAAVVGQSLGEVAAAHVAGALSLDDAIRVVAHRGRLMKLAEGMGKTAVVSLPIGQARLVLQEYQPHVAVAGSNSPRSTVLSGDPDVLQEVLAALEKQGVFCRLLAGVDVAFHSPQMEPLQPALVQALNGLQPRPAGTPIYSSVTGQLIAAEALAASYWASNLREPFLFTQVLQQLVEEGYRSFLEISPHPVLSTAIQEGFQHLGQEGMVWPSLRRNQPEKESLLRSLAALYTAGHEVDWSNLYPHGGRVVALPHYPWQRERYWFDQLDNGHSPAQRPRQKSGSHLLLGEHLQLATVNSQDAWEMELNSQSLPFLNDHRVHGRVVMPGAAYIEAALAAGHAVATGPVFLESVSFKQPLILEESQWRRTQLVLSHQASGRSTFHFYSRNTTGPAGDWVLHAQGQLGDGLGATMPLVEPIQLIQERCSEEVDSQHHYQAMSNRGLVYGPLFQTISHIWRREGEALAELQLPASLLSEQKGYYLHPVLLDGSFQLVAATLAAGDGHELYLPAAIDRLHLYAPATGRLWGHVQLRPEQAGERIADIHLFDEAGEPIAWIEGLHLQRLGGVVHPARWLYAIEWQPQEPLPTADETIEPAGSWLILADRGGVGQTLAAELTRRGYQTVCVFAGTGHHIQANGHGYYLDPADPQGFARLLTEVVPQPCQGIVYLWGMDAPPPAAANFLDEISRFVCQPVLGLVQALAQAGWTARLWLVTRRAQGPLQAADSVALAQAPLWGLGRVIAHEHPELWGGLVDLEPETPPDLLLSTLMRPDQESEVVWRQQQAYVPRLVSRAALGREQRQALPIRSDGSYLITGGFGGLGLAVACWLAEHGARRLVLMGRTPLLPRSRWHEAGEESEMAKRIKAIEAIERLGVTVYLATADVADECQLRDWLAEYDRLGWPPIRGVIHAAGVVQDQLMMHMGSAAFEAVLRPKVQGAWLLHQLLADAPLDFFVLFSSAAAVLGQMGQANYAAANAFMDALAHYRRAQERPAMSINWGVWADVGMAARLNLQSHFERQGMYAFSSDQALHLLERLLVHQPVQMAVIAADWVQLNRTRSLPNAGLLSGLLVEDSATATPPQEEIDQSLLLLSDPAEQLAQITATVHDLTAQVLRLKPERLPADHPLIYLGMDSIMAVELNNRIKTNLGLTLALSDLLMGCSVIQVAEKLVNQFWSNQELNALLDEVEQLSADEVEMLLVSAGQT